MVKTSSTLSLPIIKTLTTVIRTLTRITCSFHSPLHLQRKKMKFSVVTQYLIHTQIC